MDPSFENGLIEINLSSELDGQSNNVWYDAYILDVQPSQSQSSSAPEENVEITANDGDNVDNEKSNKNSSSDGDDEKQILMAKIVMAIKNEPVSITISQKKHCHQLPINQIRLKPNPKQIALFAENSIIEVMTVDGNEKFIAWKLAKIKKFTDTEAVVEYFDQNGQTIESKSVEELDVISRKDSRPPNSFKPLNDVTVANNPFARTELAVPFFLQQGDSKWLCNVDFHERFRKNVDNLINITYDDEKKLLICLGYTPDCTEYSKKKFNNQCQMLSDFHFRALKETHSLNKYLMPPIQNQNPNESSLRVFVAKNLLGLAIGKQGSNIKKAREIDGIQSVELYDHISSFIIKGNNMEACQQAANLLNIVQESIEIAEENMNFFNDELIMQELVDKTGIIKFELIPLEPNDSYTNDDPHHHHQYYQHDNRRNRSTTNTNQTFMLNILGNRENVDNFKVLFNYQLAEYMDMKKLREQFKGLVGGTVRSSYNQRRRPMGGRRFSDVLKNRF
ncbi:RNA-binding protein FXR1-like [Dermatophagoides pteronyssinus]|uniref:RNA-binding protein FXR1-like n=1 Tax=Dermatophagoides pteronyssinus TaxID=6956 RepID=UPI003F662A4D